MTEILIENDASLFALLERVLNEEDIDPSEIKFKGYPQYEITLRGEDFKGGIPTRVMPSLIKFQKNLRDTYSHLMYEEKGGLSDEEKRQTELVVYVDDRHSTYFWTPKVEEIFNRVLREAFNKMTGRELVITILGIAALWAGTQSYKVYINSKLKETELVFQVQLSEEETKRHTILLEAMNRSPVLTEQHDTMQEIRNSVIKSLADRDEIVFYNGETIEAGVVKKIIKKEKEIAVADRLDGNFNILSVSSGSVKNGFKIRVKQDIEGSEVIIVMVPEGTLSDKKIERLQNAEWKKETLYMEINIVKLDEQITKATLSKAGISDSE